MAERERKLTTIVAIDVAAYSRLMHLDEVGTLDRLRAARAVTDPIAEAHGARCRFNARVAAILRAIRIGHFYRKLRHSAV